MSYMEIGLFQLENLAMTPARFLFLDIRTELSPVHPHIDSLLKKAAAVSSTEVEAHLRSNLSDKTSPILLIDEDGRSAAEIARRLDAAGYTNVYVVTGGVAGLLSET